MSCNLSSNSADFEICILSGCILQIYQMHLMPPKKKKHLHIKLLPTRRHWFSGGLWPTRLGYNLADNPHSLVYLMFQIMLPQIWLQQLVSSDSQHLFCYYMYDSFTAVTQTVQGTAVAQWLRCCATKWKVAGSIPDGVIGIFHWHNPSDRTMTLGSTWPLTE